MIDKETALAEIAKFDAHYGYDSSYLVDVLKASPEGFEKFQDFKPLAYHRVELPVDAYFTAHLIATRSEDCGSCLQLVSKMAIEAGVPREIVKATLNGDESLPDELKLVRRYALCVSKQEPIDPDLLSYLKDCFGETAVAELALCIATARVFPTIKRAMGYAKSCSLVPVEV